LTGTRGPLNTNKESFAEASPVGFQHDGRRRRSTGGISKTLGERVRIRRAREKRVYGLLCITLTNFGIFSLFLARITLILHYTKTYKIRHENLFIAKYC